ncbi:FAD-binding and (Fe-S)-binding domain-containing protein [Jejudonia soesokkakensis]|uniref:FAD-binding and (Fe-S)-binding domain-containing protein n=1 Tax=Jejudonia soesokkakensis TaxID=1323432 RepID=A0ABW2MU13_9FLAO
MKQLLQNFKEEFKGDFHFDSLYTSMYATDASVYRKIPLAVAFPKTKEDIKHLIAFATKHNTSLIPRTAGTSLAGQCVGNGIVVDVSKYFTKILSVDTNNKTVTVQPGVIRDELNEFLKPYGIFFGPNTSTSNRCMIGGMVGNNSSGTTSIKYGVTRNKVLEMKTLLSDGSEVTFGPISKDNFLIKASQETVEGTIYKTLHDSLSSETARNEIKRQFPKPEIHRRNTGYAVDALLDMSLFSETNIPINLCSLLCGSEGTLAFTTEITLQLDELPPQHSAMVIAQYKSLEDSLHDVNNVMKHDLYTCEMMDNVILERTKENKKYEAYRFFIEGNPKAVLMLELRAGTKYDLQNQVASLQQSLLNANLSYARPILYGTEIDMALELRKAGLGLLGNMVGDDKAVACIEDTAVALEDLPAYILEFSALMKKYNQEAVYYAHAGAGELHLRPILNLKEKKDIAFFRKITTEVSQLVKKYKGSFSGEHGDGIVRAEFLESQIGTKNYQLLQKIKTAFDPNNIFNPGKIVNAYKMDESLRYDAEVVIEEPKTLMNFSDSQGILRLAEKCNGSGDCRKSAEASGTMCPSYQATKNEKDTTRARANVLREVLANNEAANKFNSKDLKAVFDLCISCKACGTECPSNVDMATAKAEFLYQYHQNNKVSRADTLFGKSSYYNKKAAMFPKLANGLFSNPMTSSWIKKWSGVATNRSIPKVSTNSFSRYTKNIEKQHIKNNKVRSEVVLFVDEFSNYLESEIAIDTYELLDRIGYKITIIDSLDSARALLSKGFLQEAKVEINKNVSALKTLVSETTPLIGIEPSAILGFRDEYLRLASDEASARAIAKNTHLIEEFLASEIQKGNITADLFTSEEKIIKIHSHCHQKALSNQKVTFDSLNLPLNYKPVIMTTGCCGMAGSFGYEQQHYEVSMQIGELKLFPLVRKTDKKCIIAANGTSCRHQIKDGTGREALHPVTILRQALV